MEAAIGTAARRGHLLTRGQVAEMLGVKAHTLAVWASTKRYPLKYVKVGRLVRYREEEVSAFLETQTRN